MSLSHSSLVNPSARPSASALPLAAQRGDQHRTLQLEQYLDWETVGDPQINPAGTAIVRPRENPEDVRETLGRIVTRHHARAVAVDSG